MPSSVTGDPKCTALFTVLLSREFIFQALVVLKNSMSTVRVVREKQSIYLLTRRRQTWNFFWGGLFRLYIDVANVCSMVTLIISCIFNLYDDKILMTKMLLLLVLSSCEEAGQTQQEIGAAVDFSL